MNEARDKRQREEELSEKEQKEVQELRSTDMSPAAMARAVAPRKTWFFQRGDGMIFPCEEREAWDITYNRSEWKRHDFKLIGVSDGATYAKMIKESIAEAKRLEPEIDRLSGERKRYRRAEDRLIEGQAVDMEDMEDPENAANVKKVERLRKIIDRIDDQLDALEEEYRTKVKNIVQRATDAELEVARGKIEWPSENANIITPATDERGRKKVLRAMQRADD